MPRTATSKARRALLRAVSESGTILPLVMIFATAAVTAGVITMEVGITRTKQVVTEKDERRASHMADAGIEMGYALLKLVDSDGFDNDLQSGTTETVTIKGTNYTLRVLQNTTSISGDRYKVWMTDNSDAAYVSGASNMTITSDTDDVDRAVIVVSRGEAMDAAGASVKKQKYLTALYKRVRYDSEYSLLTGGDLNFSGSSLSISGPVHTNGGMSCTNTIAGTVTASGTGDADCGASGGSPTQDFPSFTPAEALDLATEELARVGQTVTSVPPSAVLSIQAGSYRVDGSTPSGVYYVTGDVTFENANNPNVTVIATGNIRLSGGNTINGYTNFQGICMVAGADIEMSGAITIGAVGNNCYVYANEQVRISGGGNKTINGPVMARDTVPSVSSAVTLDTLNGNVSLTYSPTSPPPLGPLLGKIILWQDLG